MSRVSGLANELFEHVLYDEDPLFVSDEAILWGVSMSDQNEVLERIRRFYGVPISLEETKQFRLWQLLRLLNERRKAVTET